MRGPKSGRYLGSARCPCRTSAAPESHPSRCARCLPRPRAATAPRRVPPGLRRDCLAAGRGKSLTLYHYSQLRWSSLFIRTRGQLPGQVSGAAAEAGPHPIDRHGRRQASAPERAPPKSTLARHRGPRATAGPQQPCVRACFCCCCCVMARCGQ